jgi:hypothetical protein
MEGWNDYGVETILHSNCISKYSLLKAINKIYYKNIDIIKTQTPAGNRCLSGGIQTPDIIDQLKELKMEQLKASICIPATRMAGLKKCVDAIVKNAGVSVCDYEILWEEDKDRTGCSETLKRLVSRAKSNRIMFLADDCIPDKNFLKYALESMETLPDGWGVVGLTTIDTKLKIAINDFGHWLADKRILKYIDGGDFFPIEYRHCYVDCELQDIAKEQSRFIVSEKSKIYHSHPIHGSCKTDDVYKRAYSEENKNHDFKTYCQRKRDRMQKKYGVKLAIAVPLTDEMVYRHFFFSFIKVVTEYMSSLVKNGKSISMDVLMPDFPCQIDAARNNLVQQALLLGCTHILMMDSDQIYGTDNMIEKMLSHNKPVLGARVHRRYPPFDPLLLLGEPGKLTQVKDEDIKNPDGTFKTELHVDYTGTGCIMYDMQIFNDMIPDRWFEFKTGKDGQAIGEDIWMCHKLKEKGIDIIVDTSIDIKHLTLLAADWSTYKLFQKIMK